MLIERSGERYRLTLNPNADPTVEVPGNFHQALADRLRTVIGESGPVDIFFDLQQIPAISSRQLGLMLALKKALRGRCEKIRVSGVRENVRRLLEITQTLQFFELG